MYSKKQLHYCFSSQLVEDSLWLREDGRESGSCTAQRLQPRNNNVKVGGLIPTTDAKTVIWQTVKYGKGTGGAARCFELMWPTSTEMLTYSTQISFRNFGKDIRQILRGLDF